MLLRNFTKEIFRPDCNPQFRSLHCFAHLDEDISEVLPYLNTVLGGTGYTKDPPSLMLQVQGQLIALHPRKIAINALKDEEVADKILQWLKNVINETWQNRNTIAPSFTASEKPNFLNILKLLPKTNCRKCQQPTCSAFALLIMQGVKSSKDCPEIQDREANALEEYLHNFTFPD